MAKLINNIKIYNIDYYMVKYCCERCGYTTTFKTHYNKHINRKNPCKSILNNTSIEELRENFKNNNITPDNKTNITFVFNTL